LRTNIAYRLYIVLNNIFLNDLILLVLGNPVHLRMRTVRDEVRGEVRDQVRHGAGAEVRDGLRQPVQHGPGAKVRDPIRGQVRD
jgi:hypothetical protein